MLRSKLFLIILNFELISLLSAQYPLCPVNKCGLNGKCVLKNGAEECHCYTGWVGTICQSPDPCLSDPCHSQGVCYPVLINLSGVEQVFEYCQCYAGFSGTRCEKAGPKPCSSSPCFNDATCENDANNVDYTYVDYCKNNACQHGATCYPIPNKRQYICNCKPGYYGVLCEYEINECSIYDAPTASFKSPCLNNGHCRDLVNAYSCSCVGPFTGKNCELYVDPCASNPCPSRTSICVSKGDHYSCDCNQGYFGKYCQPNPCVRNPCNQSNSQCIPIEANSINSCSSSTNNYICICNKNTPQQFAGTTC